MQTYRSDAAFQEKIVRSIMALVDVHNTAGEKVSQVELDENIFNVAVKKNILHDVVKMQLACRRSGTAAVKSRGEVKGSTKKLFRQKGTGNARPGDIKSPLRKGGGVAFGPTQRSYAYKLPKKVRRLALKMALSSKYQGENLRIVDTINMDEIKTKAFAQIIETLESKNVLIITGDRERNLELSARNLPKVKVLCSDGLNVYDILKYEKIIFVESSLDKVARRFAA